MTNPINILNAIPEGLRVGCEDFAELIRDQYFFADKTYFLQNFAVNSSKFTLITRPRRFGKTLTLSMLDYFFNIRKALENKHLFNNLLISKDAEAMKHQGKYAVILMSLKGIKAKTYEECIKEIISLVRDLYNKHKYLLSSNKLDSNDKKIIQSFLDEKPNSVHLKKSILYLSEYLTKYYFEADSTSKVCILIDEYDAPLQYAFACEKPYHDDLIDFMKAWFGNALKGNNYMYRGVVTGISRVAMAGLFSDLNNSEFCSILDDKYANCCGLTEPEAQQALADYLKSTEQSTKLSAKKAEMKFWYNGYNFGDFHNVYTPWCASREGVYVQ